MVESLPVEKISRETIAAPRQSKLGLDCREVMFSAGSACASGSGRPSHVLKAIGLSDAQAKSSIRLGWGRYTTMSELEEGIGAILEAAAAQD